MRYVIQNVTAANFKKMGLEVSETESGFSVSVNIFRFEEQIIESGDEAVLRHSEADLIEFQNNRFLDLPFLFRDQTFLLNAEDDDKFSCKVGKRSKNDYKTLEFLIEEYNKMIGEGSWLCPCGQSNT